MTTAAQPTHIAEDEDPLLGFIQVAARLTERGRPTKPATIRSYNRLGHLPVADIQVGGRWRAVPAGARRVGRSAGPTGPLWHDRRRTHTCSGVGENPSRRS